MQKYLSAPCGMIPSEAGDYYLVTDVEREMIPRPSEEEARKAVNKVKRLVKTQCKSFRRHGLTEEIAEAEKELLRLMGVQDGR